MKSTPVVCSQTCVSISLFKILAHCCTSYTLVLIWTNSLSTQATASRLKNSASLLPRRTDNFFLFYLYWLCMALPDSLQGLTLGLRGMRIAWIWDEFNCAHICPANLGRFYWRYSEPPVSELTTLNETCKNYKKFCPDKLDEFTGS